MTTIELYTRDQEIFATSSPVVSSGDKNSVKLKVTFDSEWNNYTKTAVFYKGNNPVAWEMLLKGGECIIPFEVTAEAGYIFIGVRGITSGNKVKTSALIKYKVSNGANGNYVYEPTDDIYKQLLTRLDNLLTAGTIDGELIDMRVGADGVTYDTAGEAVRTQFENVNRGLNQLYPYSLDDEVFKIGNIVIADGEYKHIYEDGVRVSTLEGFEVPLNEGDMVYTESPITRFNVGFRSDTDEVSFSDWQYGEYTIPATGNYVFVLSHIETDENGTEYESPIENISELVRGLSIVTDNRLSNYCKWWEMSKTEQKTYTLLEEVLRYGSITVADNTVTYIDDATRVSTIEGLEIPLIKGDVISFKSPITRFNATITNPETGEVGIIGWQYSNYRVTTAGIYTFILSRVVDNSESRPESLSGFAEALTITTGSDVDNLCLWAKINNFTLPEEIDESLEAVADKVHNALEGDDVVFVHFSDTHCGTYPMTLEMTKNHMDKAVNLGEAVNADFLIHTGDIIQGDGSSTGSYGSDDKERYKTIVDSLCGSTVPFIWCQGNNNHDCGVTTDDGYALTKQQVTSYMGRFGRGLIAKAVYNDNDELKTYFYYDMPLQNCRIIVTDSSDFGEQRLVNGWSDIQITWLRSVLSDAQEKELAVILFSHMPPHTGLTPSCPDSATNVQSAVKDFITDGGNFIACIHGHVHLDNYYYDEDTGMAFITIASSWPVEQSELSILGDKSVPEREIGTSSEYAYDVYVVNAKTKKTQIFRYGAGSDRLFLNNLKTE